MPLVCARAGNSAVIDKLFVVDVRDWVWYPEKSVARRPPTGTPNRVELLLVKCPNSSGELRRNIRPFENLVFVPILACQPLRAKELIPAMGSCDARPGIKVSEVGADTDKKHPVPYLGDAKICGVDLRSVDMIGKIRPIGLPYSVPVGLPWLVGARGDVWARKLVKNIVIIREKVWP